MLIFKRANLILTSFFVIGFAIFLTSLPHQTQAFNQYEVVSIGLQDFAYHVDGNLAEALLVFGYGPGGPVTVQVCPLVENCSSPNNYVVKGGPYYSVTLTGLNFKGLFYLKFFTLSETGQPLTWPETGSIPLSTFDVTIIDPSFGYSLKFQSIMPTILSPTEVRITWFSDKLCMGGVNYGIPGSQFSTVRNDNLYRNTHSITLTGLLPNTLYEYRVICEIRDSYIENPPEGLNFTTFAEPTPTPYPTPTPEPTPTPAPPKSPNLVIQRERDATTVDLNFTRQHLGKIFIQVEEVGEAWYVNPDDNRRLFLDRPDDAFEIMRSVGLGISNENLARIPIGIMNTSNLDSDGDGLADAFEEAIGSNPFSLDSDNDGHHDYTEVQFGFNPAGPGPQGNDVDFVNSLKGKILLQVEGNGEAWYLNPLDGKRYFLSRPENAFAIMRQFGIGITNADLRKIEVGEI